MGLVVDLFAGGGGASLGVHRALGRPADLAVNHDWHALRNYRLNNPDTRLLVDDVRKVVPILVTNGQPVDVLWASPDCKHFSRAKSGKPRDESIRTLAWEVVTWARQTRPRLICMENVVEFTSWGPLDAEGYPIPEQAGETFDAWVDALRGEGYRVEWRELRAHDYGAPTKRKRWFLVARNDGQPIQWPEPTHGDGLLPYRTAAEIIDWSDLGTSLFDRKRPLADNTHARIARGLVKYVLQAQRPYFVHSGNGERNGQAPRVYSVDDQYPTIVAGGVKRRLCVAWIAKHYGGVTGHGPSRPLGAITARDSHGLCVAHMDGERSNGERVAAFLTKYYGTSTGHDVREPLATITAGGFKHGLVTVKVDGQDHVVTDVSTRMLQPHELKLAQGFPESYRLDGTKEIKVRLIGNSVPPQLSEALVRANMPREWRRAVA